LDKTLIFMHIPKTSGTTFLYLLYKQYKYHTEVLNLYHSKQLPQTGVSKEIKCIIGHHQFGIHRGLNKPFNYVTFLRDPVDRVISDYFFTKKFHNLDFESYLKLDNNLKGYNPNEKQTRWAAGNNLADIELAKSNLAKYFPIVGLTDMFDESLFLMKHQFGWGDISYKKENVNQSRLKKQEISSEIIKQIKKNNQLDLQLYKWAKKRLTNQLNSLEH
jgi:hypothetical protein